MTLPFLELAPEVRVMVYRLLFAEESKRIDLDVYNSDRRQRDVWYLRTTESCCDSQRRSRGRPVLVPQRNNLLAFLHVCRQTNSEVSPFLHDFRLHIQYRGNFEQPATTTQWTRLQDFGLHIEGLPAPSWSALASKISIISIGTTVIEEFLKSFLQHDESNDAWDQAWLQLTDSWFFPNLKKVIIFEDGRFGHGPRDIPDETPEDDEERCEYMSEEQTEFEAYLFKRCQPWHVVDEYPGICQNLNVDERTFEIVFQASRSPFRGGCLHQAQQVRARRSVLTLAVGAGAYMSKPKASF